jgi:hypothetical protein
MLLGEFRVELCDQQESFMMHYGENKGFSMIPNKVTDCMFLSLGAKQLYTCLKAYAWEKQECHPSQATLRGKLRCSRQTLLNYLKELVDKGFIIIEKGSANSVDTYHLIELHRIPMLRHSEMVHSLKPVGTEQVDEFYRAVAEYEKTDLYKSLNSCTKPEHYMTTLAQWFSDFASSEQMESEELVEEPLPAEPPRRQLNVKPSKSQEVDKVADVDKVSKPKKKKVDLNDPVLTWNCHYFMKYFEQLYVAKYKTPYFTERWDLRSLSVAIEKRGNNELLKAMMDIYFEHGEAFSKHYVSGFCGTYVQNSITAFMTTGKFYTRFDDKGEEPDEPVQSDEDDDLMNFLRKRGL